MLTAIGDAQKTLLVTCKVFGWSVLNFGAPIWASTISNTNWNHLQTKQNIAFRTTTGCVKISDINDLHNEGEMLPVKVHTEKLTEPFLAGSFQSHRADHVTISSTSLRPMRSTLNYFYSDCMKQHTNNKKKLKRRENKTLLKAIHRHMVHTHLNKDSKQLVHLPQR